MPILHSLFQCYFNKRNNAWSPLLELQIWEVFLKRGIIYIYSPTDSFYSYIFSLFVFQIVSHLLIIYLGGGGNIWACHGACLEARGQPWESILYFHHVSTGEVTQVIKLGSKHLYLQNHLAGPLVQNLWKILIKKNLLLKSVH